MVEKAADDRGPRLVDDPEERASRHAAPLVAEVVGRGIDQVRPGNSHLVIPVGQDPARQVPPAGLTIRAHAAEMLGGLKAPRTRSWSAYTIGDLVGTIAGRHGLEPRVDPALRDVVLPHVDQVDESDLSLLRRLAS